jgi:regulator of protease activity HflC (stomatin/prohibitin superfamily)
MSQYDPPDPGSGSSGSGIDPPELDLSRLRRLVVVGVVALLVVATPVVGLLAWEPVQEGNVKVVTQFGAATGATLGPGAHLINPVTQSTRSLSVRPQSYTMSSKQGEGERNRDDAIQVLTEDGLQVNVDVTVRYRIDTAQAVGFYRQYRTLDNAEERLIRPSIRSVLRTEAGRLSVTRIYTGEGQTELKVAAERELGDEFADAGIVLEAVQIRNVELPDQYAQAVEQKEITEQRRQQKQDELEVERLEADRKRIKAEGTAEANRIVSRSLSREVLTRQYIEQLDSSDVVYIPVGSDGYPQFVRNVEPNGRVNASTATATATANASAVGAGATDAAGATGAGSP